MLYLFQQYQKEITAEKETVIVQVNDDIPASINGMETRRVAASGTSADAEKYGWKEHSRISGWDIPAVYSPARKLTIYLGEKDPPITWQLYTKVA
jgi:hypothetical protein